ncbi:MAG: hypothetical protein ACE5LB_15235 [Acidiferrobacterales bacterium]
MNQEEEHRDALDDCVNAAFAVYQATRDQLDQLNVTFAETMPDGSETQELPGMGLQLSPSEILSARASISWALESWSVSGIPPEANHLCSYAQSMGGSQVATICTLSLLAQGFGTTVLLAGGHVDSVCAELRALYRSAGPSTTAQSTSPKLPLVTTPTGSTAVAGRSLTAKTRSPSSAGGPASRRGKRKSKPEASAGKKTNKTKRKSPARQGKRKRKSPTRKGKTHKSRTR